MKKQEKMEKREECLRTACEMGNDRGWEGENNGSDGENLVRAN